MASKTACGRGLSLQSSTSEPLAVELISHNLLDSLSSNIEVSCTTSSHTLLHIRRLDDKSLLPINTRHPFLLKGSGRQWTPRIWISPILYEFVNKTQKMP